MIFKIGYRLFLTFLTIIFINTKLLSQEVITTIDKKGNVLKNGTFQTKIKLNKKSYVSIIDVNYVTSIIEVYNFKSKNIISTHYWGRNGDYKTIGKIINFRKSSIKDIVKIDTSIDKSINQIYFSPIKKSDFNIVYSVYDLKVLYLSLNVIEMFVKDSINMIIEGHTEFKRNLSVNSPKFYDNGTKMAYLSGDEFSTKRYIVLYDLEKKEQLSKIEINIEATKLSISEKGQSVLLYVPTYDKKYTYDIYYESLINYEKKYIGCFKAARFD